jgi:hypothetical protein
MVLSSMGRDSSVVHAGKMLGPQHGSAILGRPQRHVNIRLGGNNACLVLLPSPSPVGRGNRLPNGVAHPLYDGLLRKAWRGC